MTLKELKVGESARIDTVGGEGALRQHFLDMGVIPGAKVKLVKLAPMGDPMELRIHGYELTLRLDDAEKIGITRIEQSEEKVADSDKEKKKHHHHPHLGEPGIYHIKGSGNPLPDNHVLTFALVGNQNCGKTTLFNRLTGANQHVGNFPGVTVDRKDGAIIGHPKTSITDLPGIYSMSPYTSEELVSRNFVLNEGMVHNMNVCHMLTPSVSVKFIFLSFFLPVPVLPGSAAGSWGLRHCRRRVLRRTASALPGWPHQRHAGASGAREAEPD